MRRLVLVAACLFAGMANAADCYVSEYAYTGAAQDGRQVQVAREPALATQRVTYTASTQSSPFQANTTYIRVICTARAHFVVGANPTATNNAPYIAAEVPEYFAVPRATRIAFYDGST